MTKANCLGNNPMKTVGVRNASAILPASLLGGTFETGCTNTREEDAWDFDETVDRSGTKQHKVFTGNNCKDCTRI